jgi:hypothetical protein
MDKLHRHARKHRLRLRLTFAMRKAQKLPVAAGSKKLQKNFAIPLAHKGGDMVYYAA